MLFRTLVWKRRLWHVTAITSQSIRREQHVHASATI